MYSFVVKNKIDKKNDKVIASINPDDKDEKIKYVCLVENDMKKSKVKFNVDDYADLLKKYKDEKEKNEVIKLLEQQFYKSAGIDNDKKSEGVQSIILNDARFSPVPVPKRMNIYFLYGSSGSGKSYYCKSVADAYHEFNPKNGVYLISKLAEDDTLDKAKYIKRVNVESFRDEKPDVKEFSDSLLIIDDYEGYESSDKEMFKIIIALIQDVSSMGRHHNISMCLCNHLHSNYRATRMVLLEATQIVVYPQSAGDNALKYLLGSYCGLTKAQIKDVKNAKSRWVTINKNFPRYTMTVDELKFL
jgi:chromosomal replication initiation ATPase DnaA